MMNVRVISPSSPVVNIEARSVVLPGVLGYMEILESHSAMVSELGTGRMTLAPVSKDKELNFFVAGGYVEVEGKMVTILVDTIDKPEKLDRDRAESAQKRATKRLKSGDHSIDVARALAALRRAEERLDIIKWSKV